MIHIFKFNDTINFFLSFYEFIICYFINKLMK